MRPKSNLTGFSWDAQRDVTQTTSEAFLYLRSTFCFSLTELEASAMRVMFLSVRSLAILGLLCHLSIILSFFFPYAQTYDPYQAVIFRATGWQVLTGAPGGCLAPFLMLALILPGLPYLACLRAFLLKSEWGDERLQKIQEIQESYVVNCLLTLGGFVFSILLLMLSQMGDFNKETHSLDAASGIPLLGFLLSLACSSVSHVLLSLVVRRLKAELR
jgi:hypothetical protein